MTVTGLGTDPQKGQMVWTSWFDASGKENHGHWPAAAVEADAGAA
jgi:hypothetical protein